MFNQILIGTLLIISTIVIQVIIISIAITLLPKFGKWLAQPPFLIKNIIAIVGIVLWLVFGISICAWLWAGTFMYVELFDSLEAALYFSTVTFTTLGYGDITLNESWRLLGSLAAVDGLIIFGLNTAFLIEFASRLRTAQESSSTEN
ncbi:MAG: potassium channel family protein [Kangiellaceae bacterium]|nr:potassium channel family protein [Kangiellaceae bacterium]MCW9000172.1 potassium channel family protein [Kangiellaceae bacterium]